MRKRLLFVLAAVLAVASAPAWAQWDSYPALEVSEAVLESASPMSLGFSIESATTFGLMRNEQDFAFEPAELATLVGWKRDRTIGNKYDPNATDDGGWYLLTNLGNVVADDTFQIGTWGKLGPGNLAIIASFNQYSDEYSGSQGYDYGYGFDFDGDSDTDLLSYMYNFNEDFQYKEKGDNLDLYLAYGLPIGDRMALGFSLRHINNKYEPEDDYDTSLSEYVDYGYDASGNVSFTFTETGDGIQTSNQKYDITSDELAIEFKWFTSDDWSFKIRGQYAQIDKDMFYKYTVHEVVNGSYADDLGVYETYTDDFAGAETTDLSFDGDEYGLGARLDWYMGDGSAWQFDLAYITGDYSFKGANPYLGQYSEFFDLTFDFGDPYGFLSFYNDLQEETQVATLTSEDVSADRWFIGGQYFWQWDMADVSIGLRYREESGETKMTGTWEDLYTDHFEIIDEFDPEVTYTAYDYNELDSGVWTSDGKYTRKWLEIPIAAELHFTDKFAAHFGAMHVFYMAEWEARDTESDLLYQWEEYIDGELVDSWVDDTTYDFSFYANTDKYDYDYTLLRVGLEYKFNDHIVAELMASETYGSPTNQEQAGFDKIVAGVAMKF